MAEVSIVGSSKRRIDAFEKVTGEARFCADFSLPGMLHAKILRCPYPHAKIIRINTSRAERIPGVRAIVTGKDAPARRFGLILEDQFVLARDSRVRALGEGVAAVAADSLEIAEHALDLIQVDYEELPAIFDPELSLRMDPPAILHPDYAEYSTQGKHHFWIHDDQRAPNVCHHFWVYDGEVDKGFEKSDLILENRFSAPRVHHCQLETHSAIAWIDPDGTLVVRTSTQGPWMVHGVLTRLFDLPPTKIRILSSYVGGGFGGKQGVIIEPICALLAIKSHRPVSLVLTRDEQFIDAHQRTSIITYIKDGVKRDGTILARQMKVIVDFGRHAESALAVTFVSGFSALAIYRIPEFKLDTYGVYTNNPITSPFRGIGVPEITWAIEQQMDMIAEAVGLDPVELRRRHILQEGELNAAGETTHASNVGQCLDAVAEWIDWSKKPQEQQGPWRKGKGIAIGNKFTSGILESSATVKVHPDATVEVRHGTSEMGQGLNTTLAQIVAEEFGTSTENIKVVFGDTAFTPYDYSAVSSRATFYTGHAVRRACLDAKRQMFEMASPMIGSASTELEVRNGEIRSRIAGGKSMRITDLFRSTGVSLGGGELLGKGQYTFRIIPQDPVSGKSAKPVVYYSYVAHAVEVAVNIETGEVKVLRIAGAFDMGTPINPQMVEGQAEGGFAMGVGTAVSEEILLDRGGVLNPNFHDYKICTSADIPLKESTAIFITKIPYEEGPYGARGVGESTLVSIAPAIANAVYQAVGVRMYAMPLTPERMWRALKEKEGWDGD